MAYVINHTFLPETIELAENYKLVVVNEHKYYDYFASYAQRSNYLTADLAYYIDETKSDYFKSLGKVVEQDKRYFAALVRTLIYEYYYNDLIKPRTIRPINYFVSAISVQKPIIEMLQEAEQLLDNDNQHFRNKENIMNTLDKYKDQASAEVTLIHGKPVELYTESELITLIRDAKIKQQDIIDLVETSTRMKTKHEQLQKDIAVYVAALDSLK